VLQFSRITFCSNPIEWKTWKPWLPISRISLWICLWKTGLMIFSKDCDWQWSALDFPQFFQDSPSRFFNNYNLSHFESLSILTMR
jgi:hypothetical protein